METIMQRDDLALHAGADNSGLAFYLNCFTLPDDEVADLQAEGFFAPAVDA